jgi:hypothetical protein
VKKIPLSLMIVAMMFVLIFAACTRSASTPVPDTQGKGEVDFPVLTEIGPTQPPYDVFATQTAEVLEKPATAAPTIVIETPTPQPTEPTPTAVLVKPTEAPTEEPPQPDATTENPDFPVYQGGTGYPTFGIRGVVRDETVTIQANDFPSNTSYTVRMGTFTSGAVNGIVIATEDSGTGGTYLATYDIPDDLKGMDRIAIRVEFSDGRYAFNWFWNTTTY